jgi:mRNA interferase MazF
MTQSSTTCNPGDVVLVPFPFTNLGQRKPRPAVVVNEPAYEAVHGDLVLVALTTQPQPQGGLALGSWRAAGLPKPTWVKPIVMTLASALVHKRLGTLQTPDWARVTAALHLMITPAFR